MQSSHLPVSSTPDICKPSTRFCLAVSWIIKGLQWANHLCHCSREIDWDWDFVARVVFGRESTGSSKYIPFMFFPANTTVPSGFLASPFPWPKVTVRPALSRVLMDTRFTFKVGVWRAQAYVIHLSLPLTL